MRFTAQNLKFSRLAFWGVFLVLGVFAYSNGAAAQDERFFRKIFTDELQPKPAPGKAKVVVETPEYAVDINRDNIPELLQVEKKDGIDFFLIKDEKGVLRAKVKLSAKGVDSSLYKIQLKTISGETDALILYFDEGESGNVIFQSTARIYIATIDERNLDKISFYKASAFYYEKERPVNQYSRRYYNVSVVDFNKDGVKEVAVSYNNIQRIFFYLGKGRWEKL